MSFTVPVRSVLITERIAFELSFYSTHIFECGALCRRCVLKNIFAVCDLEVDYAFNFMDYLNRKKNLPFEIRHFTTAESLIAYGRKSY